MSFIAEITLDALRAAGAGPLPGYTAALTAAEDAAPPPFAEAWYGQKFRRLASDGRWLAQSLVTNAAIEGDGARELWKLAASSSDAAVAQRIKRHALDESRHARLYVTMLRLAFPGVVGDTVAPGLRALSPGYRVTDELAAAEPSSDDALLDDLIQMNLGEIRTRVHQLLLRPVIAAHARGERAAEVGAVLEALLRDETAHILYTAQLIEQACADGRDHWVRRLMAQRLTEFNEITLREVGDDQYAGE